MSKENWYYIINTCFILIVSAFLIGKFKGYINAQKYHNRDLERIEHVYKIDSITIQDRYDLIEYVLKKPITDLSSLEDSIAVKKAILQTRRECVNTIK